jgi:hypothetical protein
MSKFANMTAGDVAAIVVGSMERGEEPDIASLDAWFGTASEVDGFSVISAIAAPLGPIGLSSAHAPISRKQRAYRTVFAVLNTKLNNLDGGWRTFARRRQSSDGKTPEERKADSEQEMRERESAVANVPTRKVTGVLGRHSSSYFPSVNYSWYAVKDVELFSTKEHDIMYLDDNGDGTEIEKSTGESRAKFLGENPDEMLGHVVEVEYLHKEDVNDAIAKTRSTIWADGHEVKSLKVID